MPLKKHPHHKDKISGKKRRRQVPIIRIGCKAYTRTKRAADGKSKVDDHVIKYNHELTRRAWQHLHRLKWKMTAEKAVTIDLILQSGMRPT